MIMEMIPQRKGWNELTDSEKIERMREEVKNLQRSLARANERINKMEVHAHDEDGALFVPYRYSECGFEKCGNDSGKQYF